MSKQLYCSRCGEYQGVIEKGRLNTGARIVCNDCDDHHIADDIKSHITSNLGNTAYVKGGAPNK